MTRTKAGLDTSTVDYPQQDDTVVGGIGGGPVTTTDNKLDIYLYNGTDEEHELNGLIK